MLLIPWLKDRSYRSRCVCGRCTLNLRRSPVRLEPRKSQDYRGECEPEGTTQLGRQPVFHLSLPPQEAGERGKDPDKIRAEKRRDNVAMPGGLWLVWSQKAPSRQTTRNKSTTVRHTNKNTSTSRTQTWVLLYMLRLWKNPHIKIPSWQIWIFLSCCPEKLLKHQGTIIN